MNKQEQSIILMITNMVLVFVIMQFIYTNIVLRFVIALLLFFALYKVEWYLISKKGSFKPGKTIHHSNKERMQTHYEKIKDIKEDKDE